MWKRLFWSALLGLSIYFFINQQPITSVSTAELATPIQPKIELPAELKTFANNYKNAIQRQFKEEQIPALAVCIMKDSLLLLKETWGVLDVDSLNKANNESIFRIASLSKGFAPILTGMLVEQGVLSWDDRVKQSLPNFQLSDSAATQDLNLKHILSHTTGLPRHTYSNLLNMEVPYKDILKKLPEVEVAHPVGTYYNYQNVAYCLIGDVIEAKTGKTYDAQLNQLIFQKLGMTNASTGYEAFINTKNSTRPHKRIEAGFVRKKLENTFYDVSPAAGINASIDDMEQWLYLLLGNRPDLIQSATLDTIFEPRIRISTRERHFRAWRPLERADYAMGWRVLQRGGQTIVWHSGYVNGFRAEMAFERESGYGIVLLSNATNQLVRNALPQFFDQVLKEEKKEKL
jgi:beta-lactamase class C